MDPSRAVEQQPTGPQQSSSAARDGSVSVQHHVKTGAALHLDLEGERRYTVSCSCGWESETCGTAVLAEADGEQHLTLVGIRRIPRADQR